MTIAIAIVGGILLIVLLLFVSDKRLARRQFRVGTSLETEGRYMEACYHYAISGWKRYRREECIQRVRFLWSEHGPFDFSPLLQADPDMPGCEEAGHGITLQFIDEALSIDHEPTMDLTMPEMTLDELIRHGQNFDAPAEAEEPGSDGSEPPFTKSLPVNQRLQEHDWQSGLRAASNAVAAGQREDAKQILLSILRDIEGVQPNDRIREEVERQLSVLRIEDDLSSLMNLVGAPVGASIEPEAVTKIAVRCAEVVGHARTYQSRMIIRELGGEGAIEYRVEVVRPDHFHVSRAVLPAGDYDEWVTIGDDHWRVPFGPMPEMRESEAKETRSLLVDRFSELLQGAQPSAAAAHRYAERTFVMLTYDLDHAPGLPQPKEPSQVRAQIKLWIAEQDATLSRAEILHESPGPGGKLERLEVQQAFAGYNLDIRIYPPSGIFARNSSQR